ncbi:choice-of-anchor J domain-containing protein [Flavobacterium psychraquaticum]|uniref:choice-of-anchor J domain-containing protein n=1 Tax=Flavobacterium psychraquaticum TaxID=3103958 RepID=UPI002ACEC72A|nr:choice-of-anchor J domain-containing protein [Flavobacterium sp. LB-N7T]
MKIKFLKIFLVLALATSALTSCVSEDDYSIPKIIEYTFTESFNDIPTGSGSSEIPINLTDWVNYNESGTRLWIGKTFSNNNFAEFSSFYSASGVSDKTWLITPATDLTTTTAPTLSFSTLTRFANGYPLQALVSTNYDGTTAGIATATWTELSFAKPTANDVTVRSGAIDLSNYMSSDNVRIAFKYTGSKTTGGVTTTLQLDNIKITKN